MQDVGAGWLMASLAPSPLMVALVQAATTLPMFLLALPAGALADIVGGFSVDLLTASAIVAFAAATVALAVLRNFPFHERVTEEQVRRYHRGGETPVVSHLLAAKLSAGAVQDGKSPLAF